MKISRHDLDTLMEYLEGTGAKKHKITDQCAYCQETVSQNMNTCPGCGAHVVWFESPTWKTVNGKPDAYIRSLTGDKLKGKTPLQILVVQSYGEGGRFRTETQQKQFISLERKYPDDFIKTVLLWAQEKHVPWASFVSGIKNEDWLKRWTAEQIGEAYEERRTDLSSEDLRRMRS